VGVNGILDRKLVEVELARNRVELLRVGLDNAQPDERVVAFAGVARPVERESPRLALPSLVDGAVDDHGPSMGRLVRGMETVSGRACRLHALLRLPLPPGDWLVSGEPAQRGPADRAKASTRRTLGGCVVSRLVGRRGPTPSTATVSGRDRPT